MENKNNYITLHQYLGNIEGVISSNFNNFEWVRCEIASIKKISGNYYIEVVDISESGEKTKNQTAIIYKSKELKTIHKFKSSTGLELVKGMKVLLMLKAVFTAKFSFSLLVEDIDPSFTLGEMEVKINEIREKVKKSGYQLLNKNLRSPLHFSNIAVISPNKAAGLADFTSEADFLSNNGVCNFNYFPATFEGDKAKDSILDAFKKIDSEIQNGMNYDAVVVIRGGGSKMSLHYLNEYILAVCVCRTKVPVLVGIGHEIDKVLMDEYAHYSFDTPSKVIEYITNTIFNNYFKSVDDLNNIEYLVSNNIERLIKDVGLSIQEINNKVDKIIVEEKNKVNNLVTLINNDLLGVIEYLKNKAKNNLIEIENVALFTFNKMNNNKEMLMSDILNSLENKLLIKEKDFRKLINDIKELSPEVTLKRGYAIVRNGKEVVNNVEKIKTLDKITIVFENGQVELNIKQNEEIK